MVCKSCTDEDGNYKGSMKCNDCKKGGCYHCLTEETDADFPGFVDYMCKGCFYADYGWGYRFVPVSEKSEDMIYDERWSY